MLLLLAALFWGGTLAALAIVLGGKPSTRSATSDQRADVPAQERGLAPEVRQALKGTAGIVALNALMVGMFGYGIYSAGIEDATRFFRGS